MARLCRAIGEHQLDVSATSHHWRAQSDKDTIESRFVVTATSLCRICCHYFFFHFVLLLKLVAFTQCLIDDAFVNVPVKDIWHCPQFLSHFPHFFVPCRWIVDCVISCVTSDRSFPWSHMWLLFCVCLLIVCSSPILLLSSNWLLSSLFVCLVSCLVLVDCLVWRSNLCKPKSHSWGRCSQLGHSPAWVLQLVHCQCSSFFSCKIAPGTCL